MQTKVSLIFLAFAVTLFCFAGGNRLPVQQIKFSSCNQSSDFYPEYFNCKMAIDGNSQVEDCISKVSHTKNEFNAWWSGTLEKEASISKVRIVGRTSALSCNQLDNFKIILDGGKVCAEFASSTRAFENKFFKCVGFSKTVKIQVSGSNYLNLCEVSVYGQTTKTCPARYKHDKSKLRCYSEPSAKGMNHGDAKAWCKKLGGFLPEFSTKEEIENFNSFAPDVPCGGWLDGYWLGGVQKGSKFIWASNGADLTVDAFAEGEPNNYKGDENRLGVSKNPNTKKYYNKWLDYESHFNMNVICQAH